jgi:pseudouridine-5'-phosphate glycosidase
VVPATIAIKNGICRIGLSSEELEDLAKAGEEGRAKKCSTRDLPLIMATRHQTQDPAMGDLWGATTVASTMKLAHAAGISTFVTGGCGGVHRNGHVSMDVSADLTELSRTPVVVVSAGIKSILDIERTLEVLETNSVPTIAWQTDEFPAFFSTKSGVASPARMDSADQVASAYWAARALDLPQGMMVAVPNDDPAGAKVEQAIQEALGEATRKGISGQAVTPFILKQVAEKTEGDSLRSNMALVRRNAEVGADIAIAIAASNTFSATQEQESTAGKSRNDSFSGSAAPKSMNLSVLHRSGELRMSPLSPEQPVRSEVLEHSSFLVMDGIASLSKMKSAAERAIQTHVHVVFIPSGMKNAASSARDDTFMSHLKYAVVDVEELLALSDGWTDSYEDMECARREGSLKIVKEAAKLVLNNMTPDSAFLLITLGSRGLLMGARDGKGEPLFNDFPVRENIEINKGTAASDCMCGAFLNALLEGHDQFTAAAKGVEAVDNLLFYGKSIYPLLSQFEARGRV